MGVPIPEGWACVPTDLLPDSVPSDFGAAMIRIAAHAGSAGKFFSCDIRTNDPSGLTPEEIAEMYVSGGELKFAGSLWLASVSSVSDVSVSINPPFRPLVVSGSLGWGTKSVYDGYVSALRHLGVGFGTFEYDVVRKTFMPETALKMLLAECVDVRNGYTHAWFVDGLSIPGWLLESCGLKKVLISTEDPYSLDKLSEMHPHYDYIASNEKIVARGFGLTYLPTAADPDRCLAAVRRAGGRRDIDVCFIGALFPERKKMVLELHDICLKEGLKLFVGGTCSDEDASELPYFVRGEFTTDEMLLAQASSKVCVNAFRSPYDPVSTVNSVYGAGAASMSPRCYDAPLCGAALLTDHRPEVTDVYGADCVYEGDLAEKIKFLCTGKNAEEIALRQSKEVMRSHTYVHRSLVLLGATEKGILSD